MSFLILVTALAIFVWVAIYAQRGSLLIGGLGFVLIGSCLGHEFWHARVGPIPITLDRLYLVGLVVCYVVQRRLGRTDPKPMGGVDWLLLAFLAFCTFSTFASDWRADLGSEGSAVWRLVAALYMPAALYWIVRQSQITERNTRSLWIGLALFGLYLSVTALAEVAGAWGFVFPKYIADPELGIHFGRARGPFLASQALGMFLAVCLLAVWLVATASSRLSREQPDAIQPKLMQLAAAGMGLLILAATYFTYTRAAWMAVALAMIVVLAVTLPKAWRPIIVTGMVATGLLVAVAKWDSIMGVKREGTAEESAHSVYQRQSFTYVSWNMFLDRPLLGAGYGQFYKEKLPYLADRNSEVELESIRPLHHHNTILGYLTETGLVGLSLFLALFIGWARLAWRVCQNRSAPPWVRRQGALLLGVLTAYATIGLFHEMSLIPQTHWLLFLVVGVTVGLRRWAVSSQQTKSSRHTPCAVTCAEKDPRVEQPV